MVHSCSRVMVPSGSKPAPVPVTTPVSAAQFTASVYQVPSATSAKPEEPVVRMADGRHMWRVFDNLLNNVCKYAMAGTRVYINLDKEAGRATVTFRNISAQQLNISGEELMERFVRGDSSRNTEGSGLGLSIARSLVQLQKGELELTVDGDLFKVTLKFKTLD